MRDLRSELNRGALFIAIGLQVFFNNLQFFSNSVHRRRYWMLPLPKKKWQKIVAMFRNLADTRWDDQKHTYSQIVRVVLFVRLFDSVSYFMCIYFLCISFSIYSVSCELIVIWLKRFFPAVLRLDYKFYRCVRHENFRVREKKQIRIYATSNDQKGITAAFELLAQCLCAWTLRLPIFVAFQYALTIYTFTMLLLCCPQSDSNVSLSLQILSLFPLGIFFFLCPLLLLSSGSNVWFQNKCSNIWLTVVVVFARLAKKFKIKITNNKKRNNSQLYLFSWNK